MMQAKEPSVAARPAGETEVSPAGIRVTRVSKHFRRAGKSEDFVALDDVSLDVHPGTFVSLIGASGCGKTTLMRMMAGLTPVTTGVIHINGRPVDGVPAGIGFVFQEAALLPWRTVRENLMFVLGRSAISRQKKEELVESKLALTGLADFGNYYPEALSGGMQQRVGLARALVGAPGVLFMDEPLSALDAFTRRRLQQEIAGILESSGATTVLVTHDVDEALFFSDKVVVMSTSPGRIQEVMDVPLPRPRRHEEVLHDERSIELRIRILDLILGYGGQSQLSNEKGQYK